MNRLIALLVLLIPGIFAAYGIKLMRDMIFSILQPPFTSLFVQFSAGFILFLLGLGFVAGFVLHRDRKQNKVQEKLRKRKPL